MKVLIAIPCMDTVPTGFVRSILSLQLYGEVEIAFSQGSLVYDSRNSLADKAAREGFDRIFWIDSDMTLPSNAFSLLMEDLDRGLGMVSGIYFKRKAPIEPVLFSTISSSTINGGYTASAQTMTEVPEGITLIEGVGFGCVMMEREYIDKVRAKFGLPFYPAQGFGEDLAFCWRCKELNLPMYADSRIKCGHIGQFEFTEDTFEKGEPKPWKSVF